MAPEGQINRHSQNYYPPTLSRDDKKIVCCLLTIRIHHEYEGGIEKSVLRITDWHQEACRVMTNGDHKGQIFLSHPHTNNGFFSCSPLNTSFYIGKT